MDYVTAAMNGLLTVTATAPVTRAGQDALPGLLHATTIMSDAGVAAIATRERTLCDDCLPHLVLGLARGVVHPTSATRHVGGSSLSRSLGTLT